MQIVLSLQCISFYICRRQSKTKSKTKKKNNSAVFIILFIAAFYYLIYIMSINLLKILQKYF